MTNQRLVRIIVPRNNLRDALPVERMLAALAGDFAFALEVCAQKDALHFQVRGDDDAVAHVLNQLRRAYPQCDFEEADAGFAGRPSSAIYRHIELRLREAAYLPIYTHISREGRTDHNDFAQGADPLVGLLAAMDGLSEGESCLWQIALKPMPPDWSKYWRGAAQDVNERGKFTPRVIAGAILLPMGLIWMALGLGYSVLSIIARSITQLPYGVLVLLLGVLMIYGRFRLASAPDPVLVKQKINSSAFRARIRLFITASNSEMLMQRLHRLEAAIAGYNLAGGNGFKVISIGNAEPTNVALPADSVVQKLPFVGFLRPPWRDLPILNTAEVAMLWHLPHAEAALQGLATTTSKFVLPNANLVSEGILIGQSKAQGLVIPVHLSREQLKGNIGLIAKTQSGKSNLMARITGEIIASDPDACVIVFDPHRGLAQTVAGLIPQSRQKDTVYLSLADRERPFGLNLLDRWPGSLDANRMTSATEKFADKMTSDIIATLSEIWPENWGPRMENYLRWPLLTLAHANEVMIADHHYVNWRDEMLQVGVTLADSFAKGRLSGFEWRMLQTSIASFNQLTAPPLGIIAKEYDDFQRHFSAIVNAMNQKAMGIATARIELSTQLKRFSDYLSVAVEIHHQPSGISRRVYGPHDRPLQFTLLDVGPLQLHSDFRRTVRAALPHTQFKHIQAWWKDSFGVYNAMSPRMLLEMIQPVLSKTDRFAASTVARRIFGQPETTLDLPDILDHGKILLLDLAAGVVGQDTAALVGATIMNWIASVLFARQEQRGTARKVFIVVDEFQSVPGVDYAFILSELAKYGAQLMMGTQSLEFLDEVNRKARAAWLSNAGTLFIFRCGADDAELLARELAITDQNPLSINPNDIVGLPDFTCYVRTRDRRGQQMAFHVETAKVPQTDPQLAAQLLNQSHETFGRSAKDVDDWIALAQTWQGEPDVGRNSNSGWGGAEANRGSGKRKRVEVPNGGEERPADYAKRTRERSGKAQPVVLEASGQTEP